MAETRSNVEPIDTVAGPDQATAEPATPLVAEPTPSSGRRFPWWRWRERRGRARPPRVADFGSSLVAGPPRGNVGLGLVFLSLGLELAIGGVSHAQFTERILPNGATLSATPTPQPDGSATGPPAMSADGRFVAFVSPATNLIGAGNDTNNKYDVFVADLTNGTVELVSRHTDGTQGNNDSGEMLNPVRSDIGISNDGRFVVFTSFASNLVGVNCMAMPAQVTCDGVSLGELMPGATLEIHPTSKKITLLHPNKFEYYRLLRSKLHWGRGGFNQSE